MHDLNFLSLTKKQFISITLFFLIWRIILFGLGAVADQFLSYSPSFPYADTVLIDSHLPRWLFSWANFDGVHYLTIAQKGYVGTGLVQAFFPLLPYVLLHGVHLLFGNGLNLLLFSLVITNFFTYLFALVWFGFVKELRNERSAWVALFSIFLFPTALFLGALYTESLFLLLVVLAFWVARKKSWLLVGFFVSLAAATRIVGVFLIPAL